MKRQRLAARARQSERAHKARKQAPPAPRPIGALAGRTWRPSPLACATLSLAAAWALRPSPFAPNPRQIIMSDGTRRDMADPPPRHAEIVEALAGIAAREELEKGDG
jgi:hypothetical protein